MSAEETADGERWGLAGGTCGREKGERREEPEARVPVGGDRGERQRC